MKAKIILSTAPAGNHCGDIAETLVEKGLAACVNILPLCRSVYHWQGKICSEEENLMVIKTASSKLSELRDTFLELHPYDTPEFMVLDPQDVEERYLKWLLDSVGQR